MSSGTYSRKPIEERFWAKVDIPGDASTCWIWLGGTQKGYGQFWNNDVGSNVRAHRWAYEYVLGAIPHGMTLDHTCRTKECVNPFHTEPVSAEENIRRAVPFRVLSSCRKGHPFNEKNTYYAPPDGKRYCRRCKADRQLVRMRALRSARG